MSGYEIAAIIFAFLAGLALCVLALSRFYDGEDA